MNNLFSDLNSLSWSPLLCFMVKSFALFYS